MKFVLLPSTQYDEKAEAMLDQEADYEKVAMTVDKLDEETRRFVDTHLKNKLPEKLEKAIKPSPGTHGCHGFTVSPKTIRQDCHCVPWSVLATVLQVTFR